MSEIGTAFFQQNFNTRIS